MNLSDEASEEEATRWWESMTEAGGEGTVVKPLAFVSNAAGGILAQPAIKCRGGREYLRIIYGPEYTLEENLEPRRRSLGAKRSLALRKFALGIEGLERFVRAEPLRRVHECAFAVLALESEPVEPELCEVQVKRRSKTPAPARRIRGRSSRYGRCWRVRASICA